ITIAPLPGLAQDSGPGGGFWKARLLSAANGWVVGKLGGRGAGRSNPSPPAGRGHYDVSKSRASKWRIAGASTCIRANSAWADHANSIGEHSGHKRSRAGSLVWSCAPDFSRTAKAMLSAM